MEQKKIIHYFWFSDDPLPPMVQKCIESWKKFFPDYELKWWNSKNYDVNKCDYTREAWQAKKYAFLTDYARFDVLYHYGGIYFDTDVEVIKDMSDIIKRGPYMGLEAGTIKSFIKSNKKKARSFNHSRVDPGQGMYAYPGLPLFKSVLDDYGSRHFIKSDGKFDQTNLPQYVSRSMRKHQVILKDGLAYCEGIYIYPKDYFCPLSYITKRLKITKNTRSVHWYNASWLPKWVLKLNKLFFGSPFERYHKKKDKNISNNQ